MSEWINPIGTTTDAEVKGYEPSYGIPCAVCGKFIPVTLSEVRYTTFRLCDECIEAIKFARRLRMANPRADKMLPCLEDDIK